MASVTCTFPNNENPLTDGGAGANSFENTVSATWTHPVVATAGSPGHILGPASEGTNDALAKCTADFGPDQTVTITVYRPGNGDPGPAEIEGHTRMTMIPVGAPDDEVWTHEHDWTATINTIAYWTGLQADFHIIGGGTVTELLDGDVLKMTDIGVTMSEYINDVFQFSADETSGLIPTTGKPAAGLDNDFGGAFGIKGFSAIDAGPQPPPARPIRTVATQMRW